MTRRISSQQVATLRDITDCLRAYPNQIEEEELTFFKEFLTEYSCGWLRSAPKHSPEALNDAPTADTLAQEELRKLKELKMTRSKLKNSHKEPPKAPERHTKDRSVNVPDAAETISSLVQNPQKVAEYLSNPKFAELLGAFTSKGESHNSHKAQHISEDVD